MQARFISFEGIDGAGKSTHIARTCDFIRDKAHALVQTREPGGTALGEKIRALLLNEAMSTDTEALLMYAARTEHVACVIKPALEAGTWVISDRFADASFAYQGHGRGYDLVHLQQLDDWALGGFAPDLTLLFDLDPAIAAQRMGARAQASDRFEQLDLSFFERVRRGYLARAAAAPERFEVLDASMSSEDVALHLQRTLERRYADWSRV